MMGEAALKQVSATTKIDRLKTAAEAEWKEIGKAELAGQQAITVARMHRQELGEILIKLRKEVEREHAALPSTGGRPKAIWWQWFEQWQPPKARGSITRDEAQRAMQIAGADDPPLTEAKLKERHRQRQQATRVKARRLSSVTEDGVTPESPVVSLAVRRIQGMIRKLSTEDREALLNWIEETY